MVSNTKAAAIGYILLAIALFLGAIAIYAFAGYIIMHFVLKFW